MITCVRAYVWNTRDSVSYIRRHLRQCKISMRSHLFNTQSRRNATVCDAVSVCRGVCRISGEILDLFAYQDSINQVRNNEIAFNQFLSRNWTLASRENRVITSPFLTVEQDPILSTLIVAHAMYVERQFVLNADDLYIPFPTSDPDISPPEMLHCHSYG